MRMGYKAEALPLWEEFALRFFAHRGELDGVLATADISEHLREMSGLCADTSPELSGLLATLASLDPTALPGAQHLSVDGAFDASQPHIRALQAKAPLIWMQPLLLSVLCHILLDNNGRI